MKRISFLFPCLVFLTLLCACSQDEPGGDGNAKSLRLSKLDIAGAKALAIVNGSSPRAAASRASDDGGMLFKMDENGNLVAVGVEVIELENGGKEKVVTDYNIRPLVVFPIGDRYVYLEECYLIDKNGNQRDIRADYEGENYQYWYWLEGFCILVNKQTGKIYYIPQSARALFPSKYHLPNDDMDEYENNTIVASDGSFYMHTSAGVVKVETKGDNASISSFGPQNDIISPDNNSWSFIGGQLIPLSNGPVISLVGGWNSINQCISVLYQNGGFETFDGCNDKWHSGSTDIKDEYNCTYHDGKIYALKSPASNFKSHWDYKEDGYNYQCRYDNEDVEWSLVEISIGSSYGNITVGQPFFTLTGKNYVWDDYTRPEASDWTESARKMGGVYFYVLGDYFMCGNILAINKNDKSYRDLVKEGISEHVIIPDKNNVYHGKSWQVWTDGADWFNPKDMTYGKVRWNYPANIINTEVNIPQGRITITYLNPSDGSKHMRIIDIETGDFTETDVQSSGNVIQLIPMN